jgi:ATP-dependent Lon protease
MDTALGEIRSLEQRLSGVSLPGGLSEKTREMIARLESIARLGGNYAAEFDSANRYLDWVTALPWENRSEDNLDISHAREILDKNHHGLTEVKTRVLEYLAILGLTTKQASDSRRINRAPILLLVGLAGTGKTSFAASVAEALGRSFARVPFGGLGEAAYLRGQPRSRPEAEPGAIIKVLRRAEVKNPVVLLDEVDRVDERGRAAIMGTLVELLDPEQNMSFTDYYLDYPFDLSEVLFIATANNTTNISPAVMDRLETIAMPALTDAEKTIIGRDFLLPKILRSSGLPAGAVEISPEVWPRLIRPLGFDAGLRTLERTVNGIVRRVALQFASGKPERVVVSEQNLADYI